MKKILLASTALVGFAGAAAAEVSLSGYAEIGIRGGDAIETQFHNDVVINFNFSGSTDNGLEFGGKVQLDDTNGSDPNGSPAFDDEAFWVSGSFGKVTLGETDGALDWAASEIALGTAITDDHTSQAGHYSFTGLDGMHDNQIVRYEYSFGDFGVAVSAEMDDTGVDDATFGIGFKWAGNMGGADIGVGLGYQSGELAGASVDQTALSLSAAMSNGLSVNFGYATGDFGANTYSGDWAGIAVGYQTGALLVQANYGEWNGDAGFADADGWGIVANYDLGGGAVAMAGYGDGGSTASPYAGAGEHWSLGLGLSF